MNKPHLFKPKLAASLACTALLLVASSALATVTVTPAYQAGSAGTYPFTPSWTPATDSLIAGLVPSTIGSGNFSQELSGRNPDTLTQAGSLTIDKSTSTSINYVTCGTSGGTLLIYTLPANANGYNLTNITVFGGWGDNGRDAQGYTVWYSTVSDPTNFIALTGVNYIPSGPGSTPTSTKVMITDSAGGTLAQNVAQLKFDFTFPVPGSQYNGYVGYAAITVEGTAATTPPLFTITTQTQVGTGVPFTPTYVLETPSLIAGQVPSTATGNFGYEDTNCNVDSLTEGGSLTINIVTGNAGDSIGHNTTSTNYVTCGGADGTGSLIVYTLTNSPYGSDLTNIVVYNGWADNGRMGQYYTVSYSTVAAPLTFIPITTIDYLPSVASVPTANRVAISASGSTPIAAGVYQIKFDFGSPYNAASFNNGFQGYAQIIVQGNNSATPPPPPSPLLTQDTLPSYAATIVGDQVVFTAAFSNAPPANLQWLFINGAVTNVLSGQTTTTLTLNNVQLTNSGYYTLEAVNATNGAAAPAFSTAAQLVVNAAPAPVGNVIMDYAEQAGLGPISPVNNSTNFYPTWTVNTASDLVYGFTTNANPGIPGTSYPGTNNFNLASPVAPCNPDPSILSDGSDGYISYWPNVGGNTTECSCGAGGAGDTLTFTLPATSANGFDLTNITVYGGWGDHGRNEQKYEILYSTVYNPTAFTSLGIFDYNPNDPNNEPSATRTMLIPASGALAQNVYAVEINWNVSPAPKNNWEGYSEVVVEGKPSLANPILVQDTLPAAVTTVVGDQVVFTAAYSNAPAASLQWLFVNGGVTNVLAGQTSSTLTLNNVQVTNSGNYTLEAIDVGNSAAYTFSSAASLVVSNPPAAVNNVIVDTASQISLGAFSGVNPNTNFYPTWVENVDNDLILNSQNVTPGAGNFGISGTDTASDPAVLTDGSIGYVSYSPGVGGNPTLDTLGPYLTDSTTYGGVSVTYTLDTTAAPNGYDLTNIVVYGGWGDGTHSEQNYQVLYSTVAAPGTFIALTGFVDYLPSDPNNEPVASRTTLIPAAGALARNVAAVEFSFNNQGSSPENQWEGYSELAVAGTPSLPVPTLTQNVTPTTAEDVQGSQVIITAGFSGALSYQWLKNGTNIPGATSSTLTLNNLRLTDTATNGGYSLVASNTAGVNVTASCALVVDPAPAATNNVITAFAYQTSASAGFGPTWDTTALSLSLIYGQDPPAGGYDQNGDFTGGGDQANGVQVLTDGSYGNFANDGTHPAFAAAGPGAGEYVIYTLGNNANGYDVTNIQIAGGWNDHGRDSQYYTVLYATAASPTYFVPLVAVQNNLYNYGVSDETAVRTTLTPASGVLASNVVAIYIDFTQPQGVPNGYSGYSEISVFGSPSTAVDNPPIVVTVANQQPANGTSPTWVVETDSLIEGQLPSSIGSGAFAGSFNNENPAGGLPVLTDGTFGSVNNNLSYATCGGAFGAGSSVTYTSTNGWNLTNIVVYSGWANYNRDGQWYNITYSTLSSPTTFVPLTSIAYNPPVPNGITDGGNTNASANRVDIAPGGGAVYLATNVYAVKFDFTPQTGNLDYGYSGYAEIVLQGSNLATPLVPPVVGIPGFSGGNLIVTGTGGTHNIGYTWLTATNLLTPFTNWTVAATGTLNSSGGFSNSLPVNVTNPAAFYRLWVP